LSARANVYQIRDHGVYGGISPNAYVPRVTAEVRVHYPPVSVENIETAIRELDSAWSAARDELRARARKAQDRERERLERLQSNG
jgi:hypothetical protein